MGFNFLTDKDVKEQMDQGLSEADAYELCYLLSLNTEIKLSQREKKRIQELVAKKGEKKW